MDAIRRETKLKSFLPFLHLLLACTHAEPRGKGFPEDGVEHRAPGLTVKTAKVGHFEGRREAEATISVLSQYFQDLNNSEHIPLSFIAFATPQLFTFFWKKKLILTA